MNHSTDSIDDGGITLDPPGSIVVVGAGAFGIEAALYGRFLGYDMSLMEAVAIGNSIKDQQELPLPMLPDRCLSPLALAALRAQQQDFDAQHHWTRGAGSTDSVLPMTCGQWIDEALVPLTQTDLLRGRLRIPWRVTKIVTIPVDTDDDTGGEIPSDFRLTLLGTEGQTDTLDAEAVILATGSSCDIQFEFDLPLPYIYRIRATSTGDAEQDLRQGRRETVAIFASLAGRADLDLYRPRRV